MGMGRNMIEVVLKLLDQASAPFRKAAKEVKQGSQEMAVGHNEAAKASDKATESVTRAGGASEAAGKKHKEHAKHNHELEMGYMLLAAAATAAFAAMTAGIVHSVEANNKQVAAFTGLRSVVVGTGKDYSKASEFVKSFTEDGLISQAKAAEALKNLLARGFSLDQAIEMLTRLKDAAAFGKQAHLDMGQAVASATEGLKNENSILVDNAGVTKNVSAMWKEYAKQIGKGVDSLTLAERRQAEYNGILNETRHQVGDAAKLTQQLGGQMAKAGQATEMASAALGAAWAPAVALGAKLLAGLMNLVKDLATRFPGLTFVVTALATAVVGMTAAWLSWLAFAGPIKMAMTSIAAKATVMWTAITGPVGLALAAIAAIGAALYYLATAQDRAARAAVESAKQQEAAFKDTATAARNKAKEIATEEAALQARVTELEKQGAEKRADIAKQERERRREAANRFGDLLVSALRKQLDEQKQAEEDALQKRFDKLKEFYDNRYEAAKDQAAKDKDLAEEVRDAAIDAAQETADRERDIARENHEAAVRDWEKRRDDLRTQQEREKDQDREFYDALREIARTNQQKQLEDLRDYQDRREREIRASHEAQLRRLDDQTDAQVQALEDQIDAIDKATRDEERAQRKRTRDLKIAELEAKALTADSEEERTRYKREAAEERAEAERESLLEQRDAQKEALRKQIEQVRKNAQDQRDAIRSSQERELEDLRTYVESRRKVIDQDHDKELKRIEAEEKKAAESLAKRYAEQVGQLEKERQALDDAHKSELGRIDAAEKAAIASAKRVFDEKKAKIDDGLKEKEREHQQSLDLLTQLEEAEKTAIHEKYFGKNGLLTEANLYAAALKLVHENNQKDILALLDQYEPDWKNQGKDFVQRLADGGNEAKPAVDALGEAIGTVLQAAMENVQSLQDAAGDSAVEMAKINTELSSARSALQDIQSVRQQAESEASAAERAAATAALNRARLEEELRNQQERLSGAGNPANDLSNTITETPGSSGGTSTGSAADTLTETPPPGGFTQPGTSGASSTPSTSQTATSGSSTSSGAGTSTGGNMSDANTATGGEPPRRGGRAARHGGGGIPFSGDYRLLEGEQVLSRSEAHRWERARPLLQQIGLVGLRPASAVMSRAPRLVDGAPAAARMALGGRAGGWNVALTGGLHLHFAGSPPKTEAEARRVVDLVDKALLQKVRQNDRG